MSHSKKYPIGTKIRFISKGSYDDFFDKTGTIVNIVHGYPVIYLPKSKFSKQSCFSTRDKPATVQCGWEDIKLLVGKNQQLLFNFME